MRSGEWAAWVAAVAVSLTFLIYVVLAFYARGQINEAKRLRAHQVADAERRAEEGRELRREQVRPFVVAEMVPDFIITFRVRNVGQTLARNVRVTWEAFPTVTENFAKDPVWTGPDASVLFRDGIPFLPPGQEVSTLFDHFPDRIDKGLDMQFKVTVTYEDFNESNRYEETFALDLDLYRGLRHISRKDIHDAAKELKRMADSIQKWTDTSGRGLKVAASNRDRVVAAEHRSIQLTQFLQKRDKAGLRAATLDLFDDWRERHGWKPWR